MQTLPATRSDPGAGLELREQCLRLAARPRSASTWPHRRSRRTLGDSVMAPNARSASHTLLLREHQSQDPIRVSDVGHGDGTAQVVHADSYRRV